MQRHVNLVDLVNSLVGIFFVHLPSFLNIFFKLDPNSNEYLLSLPKIGVDTAENDPLKVHFKVIGFNFHRAAPPGYGARFPAA